MYYNLDVHFINPYETDTLPIPRLWCEISTSEYPCPHYDIPEDLKPAKLLTLKMWSRELSDMGFNLYIFYTPPMFTHTNITEYIKFNHITVFVITQLMHLNNKWNSSTHVLYIMPENVSRKVPASIPITKKWNPT